jgi:predicted ATPase
MINSTPTEVIILSERERGSAMSLIKRTIELHGDQHLYGRHQEIKLLLEAYSRCKADKGRCGSVECVLITGASGMGKTSLVQSVLRPKVISDRGVFLCGKFELSPHYQPYEVIVSSFAQLADQLVGDDRLYEIQEALADALGDEVRMLTDVIPGLESVIGEQESKNVVAGTESLSRFQFVFSEFCRAISSIAPLVIFLDDMQWCDQASLELIQALLRPRLSSTESNMKSSLLLVAASRDELLDEVSSNQKSNQEQKTAEHESPQIYAINAFLNGAKASRNISRIHLSRLSEAETRELISHNFGLSKEVAQTLASRVYVKCGGNVLHTLQYMRSIQEFQQNQKDEGKVSDIVHDEPQEQETVEKLILQQIYKLPEFSQRLLQMASCMGNVINESALCAVTGRPASEIRPSLEAAAKEELLEFVHGRGHFRFVHDSVRQAVLSTIADRNAMSFRIGHALWQQPSPSCKDSNLFTVVNLLNKGINLMCAKEECYKVAELNLKAGRRAASKVSFRDASHYYTSGIQFLKKGDFWHEQYDLALQLFDAAASAELSNHNYRQVDDLIEEIFKHARCFQDKLNAYATQVMSTGQEGKAAQATNIGLDVLRQLGETVPTQTEITDITAHLIETERVLRSRSNADILSLPYMDDEEKLATLRFLLMMIPYALEAASPYANWIATRVVRLTLSHGLSKGCAHGFASYARYICKSNARLGYNYGQLAALIVEKCGAKEMLPRVYVSIYSMTSFWTRPLRESINPLQAAFEISVENGDVEYALMAAYFRSTFSMYVGMNLVQVEQLLKEARRQMHFYKQNIVLNLNNISLQFVFNLLGKAYDPKMLSGEAFTPQDREAAGNVTVSYLFLGFSSKLAYLFGDYALADQFAQELYDLSLRAPFSSYSTALNQLQIGLIAIAQARCGIQPDKNVERAQLCVKKMVGWARDCPHNFLNKKALLDAEMESLNSETSVDPKVLSLYSQAIEGALEEGFLDEAAIACERAGDYLHRVNDTVEAARFWNKAQRIFRRWGATTKVEALKARVAATTQTCSRPNALPVECAT